jgi:hypothetical protein
MLVGTKIVPDARAVFDEALADYRRHLDLSEDRGGPPLIPTEVTLHLFESAASLMEAYWHPINFQDGWEENPQFFFPPLLAKIAGEFTRWFIAGKIPEPIQDLLRPGAPANGPQEIRDQSWAVAYCNAVDEGIIQDHKRAVTCAEAFDVERRTILRWIEMNAERHVGWRDLVGPAIPDQDIPAYITERMKAAGQRYLKLRRSLKTRRPTGPSVKTVG